MPWTVDPPTYNHRYGYNDGAQEDIFIAAPLEPSSSTTTARPSSTTSESASGTAAPTTSINSNGGWRLGAGYRIPRTFLSSQQVVSNKQYFLSWWLLSPPSCGDDLPRGFKNVRV
jgi:hypothetical protein